MNECISIHVGGCGVNLFNHCWNLYRLDHGISHSGDLNLTPEMRLQGFDDTFTSFFEETDDFTFRPRAIAIDFESSSLDKIKRGPLKDMMSSNQILNLNFETKGVFGNGYYPGPKGLDISMNQFRKELEKCDSCQGVLLYSAFNGGASSGLAGRLMEEIGNANRKLQIHQYLVTPRTKALKSVVDVYNMVLHTHQTLAFSNCTIMLSNELLYNMCRDNLRMTTPTYREINQICARVIAATNTSLRFNCGTNVNLEDIELAFAPYNRLIFPSISFAPVRLPGSVREEPALFEVAKTSLQKSSQVLLENPLDGKCISACFLFRGLMRGNDIASCMREFQKMNVFKFAPPCKNVFKSSICYDNIRPTKHSAMDNYTCYVSTVVNSTSIKSLWYQIQRTFDKFYRPRDGLYRFTESGIRENDLDTAINNITQLINDYCHIEEGKVNNRCDPKVASWLKEPRDYYLDDSEDE